MRRFGEPIVKTQSYRPRPGAYAIVPAGNRVLLTRQEAPEPEFQLPGGGIDPGETAIAALHREVAEETGWRIAAPRRFGVFKRFAYLPEYDMWAEKICHIYVAWPVRAVHPPTEPGHSAHWVDLGQAIARLGNDGDRTMLARYLSGLSGRPR